MARNIQEPDLGLLNPSKKPEKMNLIKGRSSRVKTDLAGKEKRVRLQKEEGTS